MNSLFDITGKRAIVTGGSRGIGFVLARTLCEAGCKVAVTGSGDSIHAAAENLGPPDRVQGFIGDFQDSAAIERCFQEANAFLGGTDILVNNAGTQIRHPCEDFPLEDFQRLIQVNLVAAFQMAQLAGREMLAQGHGKIINIAPGYLATDNTAAIRADPMRNQEILSRIPAGRWGRPEDLAGALLFLASPASDYLSGIVLPVDGGFMGR